MFKARNPQLIKNDEKIIDELEDFEFPSETNLGTSVTTEKLITMYPDLKYGLPGNYKHVGGFRLIPQPKAMVYRPEFLEEQFLPADSLQQLANSGIFTKEGVLKQVYDYTCNPGMTFGSEIFENPTHACKFTVLTAEPCQLVLLTKSSYEAGMAKAVVAETERRLGYLMAKVFHDRLPKTISKILGQELIRHDVTVEKGKQYKTPADKRIYCISKGSFMLLDDSASGQRTDKKEQPTTVKESKAKPASNFHSLLRSPKVEPKAKRVAEVSQGDMVGILEAYMDQPYNYEFIALEDSAMMSMPFDAFNRLVEDSPYLAGFVRTHLTQARKYSKIVDEGNARLDSLLHKIKDIEGVANKSLIGKLNLGSDIGLQMVKAKQRLKGILGVRDDKQVDVFHNHSKPYWNKIQEEDPNLLEEFTELFRKKRSRIVYKRSKNHNVSTVSKSPREGSVITVKFGEEPDGAADLSNQLDFQISASLPIDYSDHHEISFVKSVDFEEERSRNMSALKSKLTRMTTQPGSKRIAGYLSKLLFNRPQTVVGSKILGDWKKAERSYDAASRDRKRRIFETLIDKSSDNEGSRSAEMSIIKLNLPVSRTQLRSSDERKTRSRIIDQRGSRRAKSTRPVYRAYTDELLY